jgi:hypothetical protein
MGWPGGLAAPTISTSDENAIPQCKNETQVSSNEEFPPVELRMFCVMAGVKTGEHFAANQWPGHSIRLDKRFWPRT